MNHYDWLELHLPVIFERLNLKWEYYKGIIGAHGDKCYSYRGIWEKSGIPFEHGVALYLLSYVDPYSKEVRQTANGWIAPDQWVIDNYERFKHCFEEIEYKDQPTRMSV